MAAIDIMPPPPQVPDTTQRTTRVYRTPTNHTFGMKTFNLPISGRLECGRYSDQSTRHQGAASTSEVIHSMTSPECSISPGLDLSPYSALNVRR